MTTADVWKFEGYGLIALVFLSFFPSVHRLHEYLFFAFLAVAIATLLGERRPLLVRTAIDLPVLGLVAWILLSIPFATDPSYSFKEWRKLAAGVLAFYWALQVLRAQPHRTLRKGILAALLLGSSLLSAYAMVEFIEQGGTWRDRTVRAAAAASDYNWLSTYLIMAFPFVVAVAIAVRGWRIRLGVALLGCLQWVAQLFSYTRAGWLAMTIESLLYGVFLRRRAVLLAIGVAAGLLAVGLVLLTLGGFQTETTSANTVYYRVASWKLMLKEIAAHPLVGSGYGNGTFMLKFGNLPEAHDASGAHNLFLMVAMGSGLPALVCLLWLFVKASHTLMTTINRANLMETPILIGTFVAIIGFAVRNLFDHMLIGMLGYLFWMILANGLAEVEYVQELTIRNTTQEAGKSRG